MTEDVCEIPRIRAAGEVHLFLRRYVLLPHRVADAAVTALKIARNPRDHRRRRRLARQVAAAGSSAPPTLEVPRADGYRRLDPDALPGQRAAAEAAAGVFAELAAAGETERIAARANKRFLVSLRPDEDLLAMPEVFALATSPELLGAATRYLGRAPVLAAVRLLWTPPNASTESSQLFHRDGECASQLKVFVNVTAVGTRCGPLTIIPARASESLPARLRRHGRVPDEALREAGVLDDPVVLTGEAGAGAAVDTSRCLHFGSRGNTEERVVLMIQLFPAAEPRGAAPAWGGALSGRTAGLDDLQLAVLNLARR